MDKRRHGLAGAMREIAEQRDSQLHNAGEIPAHRREELIAFLDAELPVESALLAAARRRDKAVALREPALSAAVHASLIEQVKSVRTPARLLALRLFPGWRGGYRTAAALAAAFVIAFTALYFFRPSSSAVSIPSDSPALSSAIAGPAFSDVSIFQRPADRLTLRANRLELASLEPSLLTINRSLPNLERVDRVLPLDLPTRQIRLDVEAVKSP
jgi:hypothetical protein